ncbi:MAG: hypothetical protein ABSB69_14930 [Solirubrobacteraceae bacterium]
MGVATLTAALGGLAAVVELHPRTVWFIVAAGAAVAGAMVLTIGVVGGYFTRYIPVREPHEATLRASADAIANCLTQGVACDYGTPRHRQAFRMHFKRGAAKLDRWDALVGVHEQAKQALKERIEAEAPERAITSPPCDVGQIVACIQSSTVERAHAHQLDASWYLPWSGSPDGGGLIQPKDDHNREWIVLPREEGESDDAWKARARALMDAVDLLGRESQDWPEATAISDAHDAMESFKPPILEGLQTIKDQAAPSYMRRCKMCKGASSL